MSRPGHQDLLLIVPEASRMWANEIRDLCH
jgi:hypothetical protein